MSKVRRIAAPFVVALAVVAAVAGSLALTSTPVQAAKPCRRICPLYCLEVTCDNGVTYCNSCLAACAGAHNCH
ncbi:MAG TPA: hypothetical protein VFB67_12845 [Candidatus Polarisedimenticolaceae bacterium]|nr:hypothetical protein [Candidatus Polarisedimenticolaceae bacterium]